MAQNSDPDPVQLLQDGICAAHALLIATPEYNYSMVRPLSGSAVAICRLPEAEICYELHGPADGPPVLLHGGIGNTEKFDNLVPALVAAGYSTVAFDAQGRSRST